MTVKLFPEKDHESLILVTSFEEDDKACELIINAIYDLAQSNVCDFLYKSHQGIMAISASGMMGGDPLDLAGMVPKHPVILIIQGLDEEELQIKEKIIDDICQKYELTTVDPASIGFEDMLDSEGLKGALGIFGNNVTAFKGAFQWAAAPFKLEMIPELWKEYKELNDKYWSGKAFRPEEELAISGFNIQGPGPFGRIGTYEVDWWWDHGHPEDLKRASLMVRKTAEYFLKHGSPIFRNMHGTADMNLPHWGVYYDLLKELKELIDPEDIMHPDALPIGKDYN